MPPRKKTVNENKSTTAKAGSTTAKKVSRPGSAKPAGGTLRDARKSTPRARKSTVPVTQKKSSAAINVDQLREDEISKQYPSFKKNNMLSALVLIVGTLLVVVGIYMQLNKAPHETSSSTTTGTNMSGTKATGDVAIAPTSGTTVTPAPTPVTSSTGTFSIADAQKVVDNFYAYFNQGKFDQIQTLYDKTFSTVPNLRQYYSPTRLESRKKNIVGDIFLTNVTAQTGDAIVQRNPRAMVFSYDTHYSLSSDGKRYGETWDAYVIQTDSGTYILNGFQCQANCGSTPFFRLK